MRIPLAVLVALTAIVFAQASQFKSYQEESSAWFKSHPGPPANASPEQRQAFDQEVAEATAEWVKHWPDDPRALMRRLNALARVKSTPDQELVETGETLLRVAKEHPYKGFRFWPYQTDVAEIWAERKIRPERCLELAQEAIRVQRQAEIDNPSAAKRYREIIARRMLQTLNLEIALATELKKFDVAESAAAEMKRYRGEHAEVPAGGNSPWTAMNKPLSAFHGIDASGRVWTIEDLKGKTTLVNVWATWCRPCVEELPAVQTMSDQLKDRKNMELLTVSVDDDFSSARRFAEQKHYSFPIIGMTSTDVDKMVGVTGVPRTWIVDLTGTVRFECVGYDRNMWPDQILRQLDAVQ